MIGDSIGKPHDDPKAWAKRILRNIHHGRRYDSRLSLEYALEALNIDREEWQTRGVEVLPEEWRK